MAESGHRSDEITRYLSDELTPEARESLEEHLAGCAECQTELAAQEALFGRVNQLLVVQPKHSVAEQVARFERQVAAERAPRLRRLRRRQVGWAVAAAAALLLIAAVIWRGAAHRPANLLEAPRAPSHR
jgi:anti-sigma factor RsiW